MSLIRRPPLREKSQDASQPATEDLSRKILGIMRHLNAKPNKEISKDLVHNQFLNFGGSETDWLEGVRAASARRWVKLNGRMISLTQIGSVIL